MQYTIADFAAHFGEKLKLVAGSQGSSKPITEVGFLDYELVKGMKGKYQRNNFYEGQLVLSTFLYAKDDSYQIIEAVRYLYNKGARGLVIKNVFRLQLPEAAIRYANVRNFPIFVLSDDVFFDEIILEVGRAIERIGDTVWSQRKIDQLVLDVDRPEAVTGCARELNPSMNAEHYVLYAVPRTRISKAGSINWGNALTSVSNMVWGLNPDAGNTLYAYNDGVLLICSGDDVDQKQVELTCDKLAEALDPDREQDGMTVIGAADEVGYHWVIGASKVHFEMSELGEAVLEARRAQRFARSRGLRVARYEQLGALQPLLPFASAAPMQRFASSVLGPIFEYDAERDAGLFDTLQAYLRNGRNLREAAADIGQHVNTVRRRLDRIEIETGLSWHETDQMDQLALACMLHKCQELLRDE